MKRLAVLSLVSASFAWLAGCSSAAELPEPDADEVSRIESALESNGGGFTDKDEAPDFGDADVSQLVGFEPRFADTTSFLSQAPAAARVYKLVLLWGHFPNATDATDTQTVPEKMDWSGSITVDQGAIALAETLRFDDKDSVTPRSDPKTITFVSRTYPAVDGVALRVAVPAGAEVLHFRTTTLTTDIDLTSLRRDAGGVAPVGDGRNALAWVGFPDAPGCTNGFVLGHWSKLKPGVGKLKATVLNDEGQRIGRVKGIWGHAKKQDKRLFFGKYITNEGTHRGLLGGTYEGGAFQGVWGDRTGEGGGLRGFYSDGYEKTDTKGVWLGRYVAPCAR